MKSYSRTPLRRNFTQILALLVGLAISAPRLSAADTRVTFEIDAGNGKTHPVTIELDESNAPLTSANFKKLVEEGFYKGIAIHRVVPNYIVQMGDPLTKDAARKSDWGTGGPGYTVPAETGQKHLRGSIAMARLSDGVNPSRASSGSQFYVCLADMPALDGDYTVFGKVVSGLEHFDRISQVAADTNNNPVNRIALIDTAVEGAPDPAAAPSLGTALASMPKKATAPATDAADTAAADAKTSMAATTAAATATPSSAPAPAPAATSAALPSVTSVGAADSSTSSALAMANAAATGAAAAVESATAGSSSSDSSPSFADGASEFSALVAEARAQAGKMIDSDPTDPADSEAALAAAKADADADAAGAAADADATASMPGRSADASDVTAQLTQPAAGQTPPRTQVGSDAADSKPAKPKKKEGFFTRMIKKVW